MVKKETSSWISRLAAKVLRTGSATVEETKDLAASALSQDETKSPKKKKAVKKIIRKADYQHKI